MKKQLLSLVAIFMIAGISNNLMAQESAIALAEATIVTPISILKTQDMNFGNVAVQSASGGTVVLTPAGVRSVTGDVTLPTTATGTVTAANFTVGGNGVYTFSIDLPSSITLTRVSGTETMTVGTFTSNGDVATGDTTATLVGGTFTLNVGATLNVAAAQVAGVYTNTADLTVTVNYN
jgi:hypothetical protein